MKINKLIISFVILFFIFNYSFVFSESIKPYERKIITTIDPGYKLKFLESNVDGSVVFMVLEDGNKEYYYLIEGVNKKLIFTREKNLSSAKLLEDLLIPLGENSPLSFFSPLKKHYGYMIVDFKGNSKVVIDGVDLGKFEYVPSINMITTPDDKHYIFAGIRNSKINVYIDGKPVLNGEEEFQKNLSFGAINEIQISPSGNKFIVIGWDYALNKYVLISNDGIINEKDIIGYAGFLNDESIYYVYANNNDYQFKLVIKGKEINLECYNVSDLMVLNENEFVYECKKFDANEKPNYYLIFKENKFGPYDQISPPIFSKIYSIRPFNKAENLYYKTLMDYVLDSNKQNIAFITSKDNNKVYLLKNGKIIKALKPDETIVYLGFVENQLVYVILDEKIKKHSLWIENNLKLKNKLIGPLTIYKDKNIIVYPVKLNNNKSVIYVNHKPYSKSYDGILDVILSPDGKNIISFAIKNKKECIVINKKEYCQYDMIGNIVNPFSFTEDGEYFTTVGTIKNNVYFDKWRLY